MIIPKTITERVSPALLGWIRLARARTGKDKEWTNGNRPRLSSIWPLNAIKIPPTVRRLYHAPVPLGIVLCIIFFILLTTGTFETSVDTRSKFDSQSLLATPPSSYADIFHDYRQSQTCHLSSHELYLPTPNQPTCASKGALLSAMSSGGRLGYDAPYQSRGCNMPMLTTPQICDTLSRFSQVHIVGDSLMRDMTSALFPYLRKDLIDGPYADYAFGHGPEEPDCTCSSIFEERRHECRFHVLISTQDIYERAPETMVCPQTETAEIHFHFLTSHPVPQEGLDDFKASLAPHGSSKPRKPIAFVLGQVLWNNLEVPLTQAWVDEIDTAIFEALPWLAQGTLLFPRLLITPNAAQWNKPDAFILTQGNVALMRFEKAIEKWTADTRQSYGARGVDCLGTYNMSVQTTSPDGIHSGWRVNLLKAMMVYNWLNAIDTLGF